MRRWTTAEENVLEQLYSTHTDAELAEKVNKSVDGVRNKRSRMGLVRKRVRADDVIPDGYVVQVTEPMPLKDIGSYTDTFVKYDIPFLVARDGDVEGYVLYREYLPDLPVVPEPAPDLWLYEWRGGECMIDRIVRMARR